MTDPATAPPHRVAQFPSSNPRVWLAYLLAGGAALIAYGLIPGGDIPAAIIYQLIGLSAAVAVIVGVRLHRPAHRAPWYAIAAGLALWSIADGLGSWWAIAIDAEAFPTPADAVYLIGYLAVTIGIALLIHAGRRGPDPAGALDSLILTTSLAVLSWVLLAKPTIETYQQSALAAVVAVSYPIADIVLAGLLIGLLTTSGGRTRAYALLVLALLLLIVADSASSALQLVTYEQTDPLDYLWLASYVAWGASALHPSMVALTAPTAPAPTRFTRTRLAVLAVAVLVAPATLAVQTALGLPPNTWAVVISSVVLFLLVVARMNLSLEQIQAANAEVAEAQAELSHQAAHDSLTGLPNRAQAMRLVSGAMNRAQRSGAVIGLLFIDLDGFKQVNDTLGHPAGDEVLRIVAGRMHEAVRAGDAVARLGGDEFVVLLEPLDEQASAMAVAERIVEVVADPMRLRSGHEVRIGASVGLAISQDADTDTERLLQEADLAVYRAKAAGRGRIEVFDRSLRDHLLRRTQLEDAIVAGLADGGVELTIRPVVELVTGELAALEGRSRCRVGSDLVDRDGLLRDLGRSPAILELDAWTLRQAAQALAGMRDQPESVAMAVPMTVQHLLVNRIRDDVALALADSGLPSSRLVLILPAHELNDDVRLIANLATLREWGIRVCLDGFGAGAATNQLLQLPVSAVRLDPALVQDASRTPAGQLDGTARGSLTEPSSLQVLRLTVQTARAFGYRVIAPGLGDETTLATATRVGCDFGQGPAATDLLQNEQAIDYLVR